MMTNKKVDLQRRKFIQTLVSLKFIPVAQIFSMLNTESLRAATNKKYLITIRSIFDFRNSGLTNYTSDLVALAPYQSKLSVYTGLGSHYEKEYHMDKQKAFATACTVVRGYAATNGGGQYDGQSFDLVVGNHLANANQSKEKYLILGAYPHQDVGVQPAFETISFLNKGQIILPQYDLDKVIENMKNALGTCFNNELVSIDIEQVKAENIIIEQTLKEYQSLIKISEGNIKEQLQTLEQNFSEKLSKNSEIIKVGGVQDTSCPKWDPNPLAHEHARTYANVPNYFDPLVRKMNHIAGYALTSNYTNSVTLNYNFSGHNQDQVPPYHACTHTGGESSAVALDEICQFQMNMLTHLLNELKQFGILEETLVVYSTHERPVHNHRDVPLIVYGAKTPGIISCAGKGLNIHDIARDILNEFGVAGADNFGGMKAKGGILG